MGDYWVDRRDPNRYPSGMVRQAWLDDTESR
jgi:hypothetical protein